MSRPRALQRVRAVEAVVHSAAPQFSGGRGRSHIARQAWSASTAIPRRSTVVEQHRFSDALAALMLVLLLVMPFGNATVVLVVFVVGVIPALVYYRSMLTRSDALALATATAGL